MGRAGGPHIVVAGAGAAGLVAAIGADEAGARVTVLEKATADAVGGNAQFSGGLFLFSHSGTADLETLVDLEGVRAEAEPYPSEEYEEALATMAEGRTDPLLVDALVADSLEGMRWLRRHGVRFRVAAAVFGTYMRGGVLRIPAGPAVESAGGGPGLVAALVEEIERRRIPIRFEAPLVDFRFDGDRIAEAVIGDGTSLGCDALVLATGGFEASPTLRRRYLGPTWQAARVRGTAHNTGEILETALRHGAAAAGDWSQCHAISVDADAAAPPAPGIPTPARFSRGFRYGITVNGLGQRFFDEGEDSWLRIYSKMGRAILSQPGEVAYHLFDGRTRERVDAAIPTVTPVVAATLEAAAAEAGISVSGLLATVREFNKAVADVPLDFDVLDGRGTVGIDPPKSNWATPIDTPPYRLYRAACGITFTHGGLRIDPHGRVIATDGRAIRGLYAAGETVGGLFFGNYPGGSSLMRSTVFGRRAALAAVRDATPTAR